MSNKHDRISQSYALRVHLCAWLASTGGATMAAIKAHCDTHHKDTIRKHVDRMVCMGCIQRVQRDGIVLFVATGKPVPTPQEIRKRLGSMNHIARQRLVESNRIRKRRADGRFMSDREMENASIYVHKMARRKPIQNQGGQGHVSPYMACSLMVIA